MKDIYWKTIPIFIDAYTCNNEESGSIKEITKKLHDSMINKAKEYASQTIGEQVIRTGNFLTVENKKVFSLGYISYEYQKKYISKKYLCIGEITPQGSDLQIIEFDYPDHWNVS